MKTKFRGCMLGTLVGDCLGAPFEGEDGSRTIVHNYFNKLDSKTAKGKYDNPFFVFPILLYLFKCCLTIVTLQLP